MTFSKVQTERISDNVSKLFKSSTNINKFS